MRFTDLGENLIFLAGSGFSGASLAAAGSEALKTLKPLAQLHEKQFQPLPSPAILLIALKFTALPFQSIH